MSADPSRKEGRLVGMTSLDWPATPPTLSDGSVTVRPWRDRDADGVYRACQDPEIQRWTRVPVPYTTKDATGFVGEYARQSWQDRTGASFAIAADGTDELLGAIGLVAIDPDNLVGEVGYWIAPWARGRKAAQRAARLLCDWALADGGLARVEICVDPENGASRAVAERLGCDFEGIFRSKVLHRGQRRDLAVYALVK
jgi:RimJ/RimL family protein N-acetyltransferase